MPATINNALTELPIPAGPEAATVVRQHVRTMFPRDNHNVDDLLLVASELATNAILHGEPPFTLSLRSEAIDYQRYAVVSITDHNPTPPAPETQPELSTCGRGLQIVDILCVEWGCTVDSANRKTMWAKMPLKS